MELLNGIGEPCALSYTGGCTTHEEVAGDDVFAYGLTTMTWIDCYIST